MMIFSIFIELLAELLDIPYLDFTVYLTDCDELAQAMKITKPWYFYGIQSSINILKIFLFYSTINSIKSLRQNAKTEDELLQVKQYKPAVPVSESSAKHFIKLTGIEIPVLTVMEYIFVERLHSADSYFQNLVVFFNNIVTTIYIILLFLSVIELLIGNLILPVNTIDSMKSTREGKTGYGSERFKDHKTVVNRITKEEYKIKSNDGVLSADEVLLTVSSFLLVIASILRFLVAIGMIETKGRFEVSGLLQGQCEQFSFGEVHNLVWVDYTILALCFVAIIAFSSGFYVDVFKRIVIRGYNFHKFSFNDDLQDLLDSKYLYTKKIFRDDLDDELATLIENYHDKSDERIWFYLQKISSTEKTVDNDIEVSNKTTENPIKKFKFDDFRYLTESYYREVALRCLGQFLTVSDIDCLILTCFHKFSRNFSELHGE